MKHRLPLSLLFVFLAIAATACGVGGTPTPRPATPTVVAVATLTPATLPSLTPTATITPTVAATATVTPTATITPTRTAAPVSRAVGTATPRVTATTAFKPPAPHGAIAYHANKDGVDRAFVANVAANPIGVTPFFDLGPIMDIAATSTRGATNAHWGDWSPDNGKFAFILTSGSNSSQILRIWDLKLNVKDRDLDSSDTGGGLSSPSWSPDGSKIAYLRVSPDQRTWSVRYVYYAPPSDTSITRIQEIRTNQPNEQYRGGISWGKDGRLVLAANLTGASDVYMLNTDGSGFAALTNDPADDTNPVWSPDGKQIAFTSTRPGNAQIYVMTADGKNLRRLSNNTFKEFSPSWSSDGNWIAFTSTRDGTPNIFIMDKNGGNQTRVTTDGGDDPIWSH